MARKYKQGFFTPENPKKYSGDVNNIVYRSGWERKIFRKLDIDQRCIEWSSEEVVIPYKSPIDNKIHRYFVDVKATFIYPDKSLKTFLVEIKPFKQTIEPKPKQGKKKQVFLNEVLTYSVNQAKWDAAIKYCQEKNWQFKIMTEKEIGM